MDSDEDFDFIRRRPSPVKINVMEASPVEDTDSLRPVTPPMDESLKLNKSLGLVLSPQSPPYRRMRCIKLVESPRVPLFEPLKPRFGPCTSTPSASPGIHNRRVPIRFQRFNRNMEKEKLNMSSGCVPSVYLNPFTPNGRAVTDSKLKNKSKRMSPHSLSFGSDENTEAEVSDYEAKKPRLSDFNISRYQKEFLQLDIIGSGVHGCVFKCLNRLNGVEYAVKRGIKPFNNEKIAHKEIYAHAVLEHPNIVRNYSSWTEDDHIFLQNEYCNGGSLEEVIKNGPLDEKELRIILEHIARGLRFIHSKQLAHMDIKPGNILIHKGPKVFFKQSCCVDECCEDDDANEDTTYKIADLGHVIRLDEEVDVEEGDCRYLPREILQDDYSHLDKVDIFALGLTLYEAAGGGPLPKNGDEWQEIRDGKLKKFPHLSSGFHNILKKMTHPNPEQRPSANDLVAFSNPAPVYKTVKEKHELKAAKQKIQLLEQQLQQVFKCVKVLSAQTEKKTGSRIPTLITHKERLVGKKSKRSQSTTTF